VLLKMFVLYCRLFTVQRQIFNAYSEIVQYCMKIKQKRERNRTLATTSLDCHEIGMGTKQKISITYQIVYLFTFNLFSESDCIIGILHCDNNIIYMSISCQYNLS
jgi:hypothetical protein